MPIVTAKVGNDLAKSTEELMDAMRCDQLITRFSSVIIKPNLCCLKPPETGATTDVRIVEAIVRYIHRVDSDIQVSIVESSSLGRSARARFKKLGYTRLEAVRLVDLTLEDKLRNIGGILLPEILFGGLFISVPKLKTHYFDVGCVLKNQFGCVPDRDKHKFHPILAEAVWKINAAIKPGACVVDAVFAMEGMGPIDGKPRKLDMLIGGLDINEVDQFATTLMDRASFKPPPSDLRHLLRTSHRLARGFPHMPSYLLEELLINVWRVREKMHI